MFDFLWTKKNIPTKVSEISFYSVPLVWSEHCVECAAPVCYVTCKKYKQRKDGNCVRIVDAISPTSDFANVGAKVSFRAWAKIESPYYNNLIEGKSATKLMRKVLVGDKLAKKLSSLFFACGIRRGGKFVTDKWYGARMRLIHKTLVGKPQARVLSLVGELTYDSNNTVSLIIDLKSDARLISRHRIELKQALNKISVPVPSIDEGNERKYINIHPADPDAEFTITINSLELVDADACMPKVKCLIWDLDNTLWDGVLIENEQVNLREEFVQLIKKLDKKGIIHSISSKNNMDDAMVKLKEFGLDEYFVFPKINWNPKGANITQTIKQLNIKPDTIVFVDDNPFERSQVSESIESITCIDPSDLMEYSKTERFKVIVNEDSAKRRSTYKMMEQMKQEEEDWTGNIDSFLQSCKLEVTLQKPNETTSDRCFELIQRTNQLNTSSRRLMREEVEKIVSDDKSYMSVVINAKDKFGDYGVVGFMIVDCKKVCVTDFVMSCRVANRKIEPSVIDYISERYFGGKVSMVYVPTVKNTPMRQIITDLKMAKVGENIFSYEHIKQPVVLTINDQLEK